MSCGLIESEHLTARLPVSILMTQVPRREVGVSRAGVSPRSAFTL
jgi:hypothetical protein